MATYEDVYGEWRADPEAFWMQQAEAIDWISKPSKALSDENAPLYEWYADGEMNTCWNAIDRHVEAGRGQQTAIVYDSPVTSTKRTITYAELQAEVARLHKQATELYQAVQKLQGVNRRIKRKIERRQAWEIQGDSGR